MIIKLLPNQIPQYWDYIKYAYTKNNNLLKIDNYKKYLRKLLMDLLSSKAQVFIVYDENKNLISILITIIIIDKLTQEKTLSIESFILFKFMRNLNGTDEIEFIKDFARKENCKQVITKTNRKGFERFFGRLDFEERFREFIIYL